MEPEDPAEPEKLTEEELSVLNALIDEADLLLGDLGVCGMNWPKRRGILHSILGDFTTLPVMVEVGWQDGVEVLKILLDYFPTVLSEAVAVTRTGRVHRIQAHVTRPIFQLQPLHQPKQTGLRWRSAKKLLLRLKTIDGFPVVQWISRHLTFLATLATEWIESLPSLALACRFLIEQQEEIFISLFKILSAEEQKHDLLLGQSSKIPAVGGLPIHPRPATTEQQSSYQPPAASSHVASPRLLAKKTSQTPRTKRSPASHSSL